MVENILWIAFAAAINQDGNGLNFWDNDVFVWRIEEEIIKAAFGRRENWMMMEYQCSKKYCRNGQ